MRSPTLAEHKRRAKGKQKVSSQKDTTPHRTEAQHYDRELSVYDGSFWIGNVKQNGRRFDAFATTPVYRFLGSFRSLKEASDAVSAAYEGAS